MVSNSAPGRCKADHALVLSDVEGTLRREKTMSYRIAISLAAAAIGISYIATDASARGAGGNRPEAVGFGAGAGTGGVGGAVAAPSYAVPLYDAAPSTGRPACGYYPNPRCRRH